MSKHRLYSSMDPNPTTEEMENFASVIENLVAGTDYTYLEAIVEYCSKTGLEVEVAATLINPNMKNKIQKQSLERKLITDDEASLPF